MTYEDLKDIPAYYPTAVMDYGRKHAGTYQIGYVTWAYHFRGDIVFRTYGFKLVKGEFCINEVIRTTPDLELGIVKDMYRTTMAGYRVVFKPETRRGSWGTLFDRSDFGRWYSDEIPGITHTIINPQAIMECPRYQYCGLTDGIVNVLHYLREYNRNPGVEFFGKLGIYPHRSLVNKAKKDRQFMRYLRDHVDDVRGFGAQAVIYAYENKKPVNEAYRELSDKRDTSRFVCYICPEIKETKIDRAKVKEYIESGGRKWSTYNDYLKAIKYLGLDLKDTKNIFPKDLNRMHDLRASEYASKKAQEDREKRAELYEKFAKVCDSLACLAMADGDYMAVIPSDVSDLLKEGDKLHHCVGRMGYDAKVANGKSIIVFIRKVTEPDVPFVTVEYIRATNKVSQCYADHDSKPADDVRAWVDAWAIKAKEILAA